MNSTLHYIVQAFNLLCCLCLKYDYSEWWHVLNGNVTLITIFMRRENRNRTKCCTHTIRKWKLIENNLVVVVDAFLWSCKEISEVTFPGCPVLWNTEFLNMQLLYSRTLLGFGKTKNWLIASSAQKMRAPFDQLCIWKFLFTVTFRNFWWLWKLLEASFGFSLKVFSNSFYGLHLNVPSFARSFPVYSKSRTYIPRFWQLMERCVHPCWNIANGRNLEALNIFPLNQFMKIKCGFSGVCIQIVSHTL